MSSAHTEPPFWNRVEGRFFERRDSRDFRASSGSLAPPSQFPNATRNRMVLARTLGIAGILASGVLAVVAVRAGASSISARFDAVHFPWDPVLNPGPAPLELDRLPGASVNPSERVALVEPAPVSEPAALSELALPSEPAVSIEPIAPAEPPAPAEPDAAPAERATPIESTPRALSKAPSESTPPESLSVRSEQQERTAEPELTPDEIQFRKDRYERWLKDEGLERIQ